VLLGVSLLAVRGLSEQEPLNVRLATAAWAAFNKADYEQAIVASERCAAEFQGTADREQQRLEAAKVQDPPIGAVSATDKATILARGPLNDVATCFWIKGRAAENLGRVSEARVAYQSAGRYTYARAWDPQGWFWAPGQDARDRLLRLPR
jgi:hypothetical protein